MATNTLAFICETYPQLTTYGFDGSTFSQVGNQLTISTNTPEMTALYSTRIIVFYASPDGIVPSTLQAYDFDGTDWTAVGNPYDINTITLEASLCALSTTTFALVYQEVDNLTLKTMRFNGSNFSNVGNTYSFGNTSGPVMCTLSGTSIAFIEVGFGKLYTMEFDGTDWVQVGNQYSFGGITNPSITALSSSRIVVTDYTGALSRFIAYDFDGTDWAQVGNATTILFTSLVNPAMSAFSDSKFFYTQGNINLKAIRAYEFDGSDFIELGTQQTFADNLINPALTSLDYFLFPQSSNEYTQITQMVGAETGEVQTINAGKDDDGEPIDFELTTQEIEFDNRSHLKNISDKIVVFTDYGIDSWLEAQQDDGDFKPIPVKLNDTVNIGQDINLKGNFFTFRWSGTANETSPILEGIYLEKVTDLGITYE